MNNNKLVAIVFSKNRPLQLDLILSSFYNYCLEYVNTYVLYTTTSFNQEKAYDIVKTEHPTVKFCLEKNFKFDLLQILQNKTHVLLLVDDCIFVKEFSIDIILKSLISNVIGFSLRLGKNINYCYPVKTSQEINVCYESNEFILENWVQGQYDFGYPMELSSSFYSLETIGELLKTGEYNNPNNLESFLNLNRGYFVDNKSYLAMFKQSVAFCAPMNKVQDVAPNNRVSDNLNYSVENLLKLYLDGVRINPKIFYDYVPSSPHEEIAFLENYSKKKKE